MEKNRDIFTAILSAILGFLVAKYSGNTYLGLLILSIIFLVIYLVKKL